MLKRRWMASPSYLIQGIINLYHALGGGAD